MLPTFIIKEHAGKKGNFMYFTNQTHKPPKFCLKVTTGHWLIWLKEPWGCANPKVFSQSNDLTFPQKPVFIFHLGNNSTGNAN